MASLSTQTASLLFLLCSAGVAASFLQARHPNTRRFAKDCGTKRHWSLAQFEKTPGAGVDPASITPYSTVLKDGYMYVSCVKDMLYASGDKFGDNKYSYNLGDVANVSIVHYSAFVPKEDRELMTHDVCFKFCRTIPHMGFFGIFNGRDCYCTPYYKQVAGDSSQCTAVCEGSTGSFCGGTEKSSIFEMHMCSDTAMELSNATDKASSTAASAEDVGLKLKSLSATMQSEADAAQKAFGRVGDPVASDLMQVTKAWAGKLEHAAEDALAAGKQLGTVIGKADKLSGAEFSKSSEVTLADELVVDMGAGVSATQKKVEVASELLGLATRGNGTTGRKAEYYPLMYFVNKSFVDVPTTCGGEWDKQTIFGSTAECAHACDMQTVKPECVGFSFYEGGLCLLFTKFTSVTYYTKCDAPKAPLPPPTAPVSKPVKVKSPTPPPLAQPVLLSQPIPEPGMVPEPGMAPVPEPGMGVKAASTPTGATQCFAKLEDFEGTSLSPDPSGKCELCLTKATKADRCFK